MNNDQSMFDFIMEIPEEIRKCFYSLDLQEIANTTEPIRKRLINTYFVKLYSKKTKNWVGHDEPAAYFLDRSIALDAEGCQELSGVFSCDDFSYKYPYPKEKVLDILPKLRNC